MSNVSHLKGAYGHGLLHLIILISWTLLGNEYSDSSRLKAEYASTLENRRMGGR